MAKRLKSVFTDDMDTCYFTDESPASRHHIFGGANRKKSEKYHYIMPLAPKLHQFEKGSVHDSPGTGLDLQLKQMAQIHYEKNHGSREDFLAEFGKSWLE